MQTEALYQHYLKHPEITTDSRNVNPGSLFFALSGENFDGNTFADDALKKGAAYAVIDNAAYNKSNQHILVADTLKALQELAAYHRKQLSIPVIGITGSNGKTTTKELLLKVLSKRYTVLGTSGNLNNHIGVPLTLLNIRKNHQMAVIEMGANHPGEIAFLCELARPTHGLVTSVGKAHIKGFGSFEGVKKTKKELYDFLADNDGAIVLNAEDKELMQMAPSMQHVTSFGFKMPKADIRVEDISLNPFLVLYWEATNHRIHKIETHLPGRFHWTNVMNAVAMGVVFDVPSDSINKAISSYVPDNNRSQIVKTTHNEIFLDAYNANPSSMIAALDYFFEVKKRNKVLILGEMLELGDISEKEHHNLVRHILKKADMLDEAYLVGPSFKHFADNRFINFTSTSELKDFLTSHPLRNKTILLKGSRGNRLESITYLL